MIVTQYGQISRENSLAVDGRGGLGRQSISAMEHLRAHYGLTPHGSPTSGMAYLHHAPGLTTLTPAMRTLTLSVQTQPGSYAASEKLALRAEIDMSTNFRGQADSEGQMACANCMRLRTAGQAWC